MYNVGDEVGVVYISIPSFSVQLKFRISYLLQDDSQIFLEKIWNSVDRFGEFLRLGTVHFSMCLFLNSWAHNVSRIQVAHHGTNLPYDVT